MNILVTVDRNYLTILNIMLSSLVRSNPRETLDVYLLHTCLEEAQLTATRRVLAGHGRLIPIQAAIPALDSAPITDRYPREMYYRIFAAQCLPRELDRVLYLDPDMVILGSLAELYHMDLGDHFFAAATHVKRLMRKLNELRLDMEEDSPYINSGVMLMNLAALRREQDPQAVFAYIEKYKNALMLPDQDVISGLYGGRILELDTLRYNMTEILLAKKRSLRPEMDLDWVRKNCTIIHYCGRNKPWKANYLGILDVFYREAVEALDAET